MVLKGAGFLIKLGGTEMLSNAKKLTIATLFTGLVVSLGVAFGANGISSVRAASQITGNHYTAKAPTFSEPGCKEYWIDCLTKTIYFSQPLEGNWHDNGVAVPVNDPTDPRYIAPVSEEETLPTNEDINNTRINQDEVIVEDDTTDNTGLIITDQNGNVGQEVKVEEEVDYNVISYVGDNKTVVIPEGVVTLDTYNASGSSAWNGNPFDGNNINSNASIIETVIIPSTVTYLHVGCFKNMTNLKTVVIGAQEIYYGAFSNCPNLKNVYIKNSCKTIAQGAFIESRATNMQIFCEATSQPSGWQSNWNIRAWTYPVTVYEATFGVAY